VAQATKSFDAKQRAEQEDTHNPRQTSQEWDNRIANQQQWRREGHQKKMLNHVGAKEDIGKSIEWRNNGEPDDRKTKKKRR
jgi:hypothetical protein